MLFEASRPTTRPLFFNREHELRELRQSVASLRLGSGHYLALLGFRKTGKTSLLRQFMEDTEDIDDVVVFSVDCWRQRPTPRSFLLDYLVEALDAYVRKRQPGLLRSPLKACLTDETRLLLAVSSLRSLGLDSLDRAAHSLVEVHRGEVSEATFTSAISLPEELAEETGVYFTVILDEFQELQRLGRFRLNGEPLGDVFALLRGQWQRQRRTNYIVSGSRVSMMRDILTDGRSPLFQHFRIMELEGLPEVDAASLLRDLSHASGRPIPEPLIARTIALVGTNPFYLQVLGGELCGHAQLDEDAFKVTVQQTLFSSTGRLALYFGDLTGQVVGTSARLQEVLVEAATRPGTLSQLADRLHVGTGMLKSWIDRTAGLIQVSEGAYSVADPCLALWLANQSDRRAVLPPTVLGDDAEKLVAQRLAEAGYELVYQSRASRGAFDLLGILGTREIGVQVKKGSFPYYLGKEEFHLMRHWGKQLNWVPLLALVVDDRAHFYEVANLRARGDSVRIDAKKPTVENLLEL